MRVASTWKTRSSGLRKAVLPGKKGRYLPEKIPAARGGNAMAG